MQHETELVAFLQEVAELRVNALTERANGESNFAKVNQSLRDFIESVTDNNVRAALLQYEELKNDYLALIMPYVYVEGAKDGLTTYGILMKCVHSDCG